MSKFMAMLCAPALWLALVCCEGVGICAQAQAQVQSPATAVARSHAEEMAEWWNHIGNRLIAMAEDFPEEKYDFKVQKDERTFAQNLLHVAAVDYDLISRIAGSKMGPDFGEDGHNPSRERYRTKADVVKLLRQAVAEQGHARGGGVRSRLRAEARR